jgi:hypothetical protein
MLGLNSNYVYAINIGLDAITCLGNSVIPAFVSIRLFLPKTCVAGEKSRNESILLFSFCYVQ